MTSVALHGATAVLLFLLLVRWETWDRGRYPSPPPLSRKGEGR